jgi:hypothetical protein
MDSPPGDRPAPAPPPPTSINDAVDRLTTIVDWSRTNRRRVGYFAAMYRRVTIAVQAAIEAGEFEDDERMRRLVVLFAGRYIDAWESFVSDRPTTKAWDLSLRAADHWRPIVVQQLLTGMNAHINLDLGIAAAKVASGTDIGHLRHDFEKINDILASMVDGFVRDVSRVSPWIGLLDRIGGRTDQAMVRFSIDKARAGAWRLATELAGLPDSDWTPAIDARDDWSAGFGELLLSPGKMLPVGLFVIRMRESNDIVRVIDALAV